MSSGEKKETKAKITLTWIGQQCIVDIEEGSFLTARMIERSTGVVLRELRRMNMQLTMDRRKRERAEAANTPDGVEQFSTAEEIEGDEVAAEEETKDFSTAMELLDEALSRTDSDTNSETLTGDSNV